MLIIRYSRSSFTRPTIMVLLLPSVSVIKSIFCQCTSIIHIIAGETETAFPIAGDRRLQLDARYNMTGASLNLEALFNIFLTLSHFIEHIQSVHYFFHVSSVGLLADSFQGILCGGLNSLLSYLLKADWFGIQLAYQVFMTGSTPDSDGETQT